MSAPSGKPGPNVRSAMPAFGAFGPHQASASMLLEKANPGLRRSTPDSEALASSDDEIEQNKANATSNPKAPKGGRRTSWLNDISASNPNRKPSITAPYSPSTSNPGTPAAEQSSWTSMTSPAGTAWSGSNASYSWGNIWGQDNRKEPPSRLQEVLPANGESGIPFSIPLQPTPKTYRSQSYSVGQLDTSIVIPPALTGTSGEASRNRLNGQYPPLQRRTSRTSGIDGGGLGRLREVDDDGNDDTSVREESDTLATSQARMIEKLERENAQLRHAAQSRDRTFSATSSTTHVPVTTFRNSRIRDIVPEESETAVDDNEDIPALANFPGRDANGRRIVDQLSPLENRTLENVKKAHWQTSLGFGSIPEPPQSRRHSFADVPTRHGSFSSSDRDNGVAPFERGIPEVSPGDDRELALSLSQPSEEEMKKEYLFNRTHAAVYFNTTESTRRAAEASVHQSYMNVNPYAQTSHVGAYLGPASQPLFIVNFKCCRSDVFYIQEGTGLHVNVGDLVIVEADRGTDLGTVQHTNVTWDEARRYKDYYAEEHYKWLMMFSQQSRNGGPNVVNPNGLTAKQGSAVGGMGPQGHHGSHESSHGELKPKMIKRLAQNHEIQALKDKEGNEAKAKRVCQQKVVEHRLNMEILDAEFQMDSKKLTFYYFADTYINFNSLVTDLFKIYKTRIWMSAINPASFQTPTSQLGLTPAYGGNNIPAGRDSPNGRRRQYGPGNPAASPFGDAFDADRAFAEQGPGIRNTYMSSFQSMGPGNQSIGSPVPAYGGTMQPQMDPFSPYYAQPYQMLNPTAANFATNRSGFGNRASNQSPDQNWTGRFQGLSLGS